MADGPNRYAHKLSKHNCGVVPVDSQTGFHPGLRSIDRALYDDNVPGFCYGAKALGLPACVLGDEGSFRGEFFPVIEAEIAEGPYFERHSPSAWDAEAFHAWVEARAAEGRRKVVLGGLSMDNCTCMTARDTNPRGL